MLKLSLALAAISCPLFVHGDAHAATQSAWDNHGAAFMGSDVDMIMADYNEESEMVVKDFGSGGSRVIVGLDGIRAAFTGLFEYLEASDAGESGEADATVHPTGTSVADLTVTATQVFLAWRCPGAGVTHATDTFIMGADGKFATQTVTMWTTADKPFLTVDDTDLNKAVLETGAQTHWDNHLDAFATGNLTKMVLDYRDDAQIIEFDFATDTKNVYNGIAGVEELFPKYFGWAGACGTALDVDLPTIRVDDANDGVTGGGYIYLDVRFACAGIPKWTDTFVIDGDGMIVTQNIIFESGFEKTTGEPAEAEDTSSGDGGDEGTSSATALTSSVAVVAAFAALF